MYENEVAFQEAAAEWAGNEEEALELVPVDIVERYRILGPARQGKPVEFVRHNEIHIYGRIG